MVVSAFILILASTGCAAFYPGPPRDEREAASGDLDKALDYAATTQKRYRDFSDGWASTFKVLEATLIGLAGVATGMAATGPRGDTLAILGVTVHGPIRLLYCNEPTKR